MEPNAKQVVAVAHFTPLSSTFGGPSGLGLITMANGLLAPAAPTDPTVTPPASNATIDSGATAPPAHHQPRRPCPGLDIDTD
ncbi:MAG: hypothetical protein ACXWA9_12935 [Acidimicrobiia bacterium]